MSDTRVPTKIGPFNDYINDTDDYQQTVETPSTKHVWERLGLSSQNSTDWSDKRTYWHDTLYPKYTNPVTSSSPVKKEVRTFKKDFAVFARPLLTIMSVSPNATADDEAHFRFTITRKDPVTRKDSIEESIVVDAIQLGSGNMRIKCRTSHDTKRASLPGSADSVELIFKIFSTMPDPKTLRIGSDGSGALSDPIDGGDKKIFTSSSFVLKTGSGSSGKYLVAYARWNHTKHPERAGKWSALVIVPIL